MRLPSGPEFDRVNELLGRHRLHTVCSSARCPNLTDCWSAGTATIMILGDTCTRHCRFCAVQTGNLHGKIDTNEPERVARAVQELGLKYVVLTAVDRDDLPDWGAGVFAATVRHIRQLQHDVRIEVLTPDFGGRQELVQLVVDARPDVFGHNIETVERLTPAIRDHRAGYRQSLAVLQIVKRRAPDFLTKSGLMVGLGETDAEVGQTMKDLRSVGCDILTIGQYLQPDRRALPVQRYVTPEQFGQWQSQALALGFRQALCGPLVRSSYRAAELTERALEH